MGSPLLPTQIVPARLSYLAIYRPALTTSDETFSSQLVYYFSRQTYEARVAKNLHAQHDAAVAELHRKEENERLRHIGLAQGILDFARAFSDNQPVDSIESERTRTVLHELEDGWWILASIELTQVIHEAPTTSSKSARSPNVKLSIEHSSREVSPPALLLVQLKRAHYMFCLHHGPSLSDLYVRLSRDGFCGILDRYWNKFARRWDVMLQGNPAVDIFNGIKLAYGGELGFGVGEEEWGSSEREVLEDLINRTDGLVDLVVSRFGDTSNKKPDSTRQDLTIKRLTWLGQRANPTVTDGVIFSGTGSLTRSSLRSLSLWMQHIYVYGEHAYGVKDNPARERRSRRRRNSEKITGKSDSAIDSSHNGATTSRRSEPERAADVVPTKHDSKAGPTIASEQAQSRTRMVVQGSARNIPPNTNDSHISPSIPPPVAIVGPSSEKASGKIGHVGQREQHSREYPEHTTLGIPDQYMKYLTFGLSKLGTSSPNPSHTPEGDSMANAPTQFTLQDKNSGMSSTDRNELSGDLTDKAALRQLTPMPVDETIRSSSVIDIHQEDKGYFLIGLKGDLDSSSDGTGRCLEDDAFVDDYGTRISLRTLHVESRKHSKDNNIPTPDNGSGKRHQYDDEEINISTRVRVLVYIRRPFIFCFLFESRTSSLQWTKFYRNLHQSLTPIYKPLLSSTSVSSAIKKIQSLHAKPYDLDSSSIYTNFIESKDANPFYDLAFNPELFTLHTSIPNIPEPGTLAGGYLDLDDRRVASSTWTRAEAINVHSQIMAIMQSARGDTYGVERACKTTRGWWVVWLRLPYAAVPHKQNYTNKDDGDKNVLPGDAGVHGYRIAFLVRKASDAVASSEMPSAGSRAMSGMLNTMTFGLSGQSYKDPVIEASDGWGPAALTGGIGVDARDYSMRLACLI